MGLSTADLREIKSVIVNVFNEKFLQDIADKVAKMVNSQFEEQIKAQNCIIASLREKSSNLEEENKQLRKSLDNQEQSLRNSNLRIFGIKYEKDENLRSKVLDLFVRDLKTNIQNIDLKKCHRIVPMNAGDKPPAVLVEFSTDAARVSILKNRKFLKNSGISIKEDLTKIRLALFNSAVREFSNKNTWLLHGNIYVRHNNIVHRISDEPELNKLMER